MASGIDDSGLTSKHVQIVKVLEPNRFIVCESRGTQISTELQRFYNMERCLQNIENDEDEYGYLLQIRNQSPIPAKGSLLVVKSYYDNKKWFRGRVDAIFETSRDPVVNVYLVDYGKTINAELNEFLYPDSAIFNVPFQAVEFVLHDLQPMGLVMLATDDLRMERRPTKKWDTAALQYVTEIIKERPAGEILIRHRDDENGIFYGSMYVHVMKERTCLNEHLISLKYACFSVENKSTFKPPKRLSNEKKVGTSSRSGADAEWQDVSESVAEMFPESPIVQYRKKLSQNMLKSHSLRPPLTYPKLLWKASQENNQNASRTTSAATLPSSCSPFLPSPQIEQSIDQDRFLTKPSSHLWDGEETVRDYEKDSDDDRDHNFLATPSPSINQTLLLNNSANNLRGRARPNLFHLIRRGRGEGITPPDNPDYGHGFGRARTREHQILNNAEHLRLIESSSEAMSLTSSPPNTALSNYNPIRAYSNPVSEERTGRLKRGVSRWQKAQQSLNGSRVISIDSESRNISVDAEDGVERSRLDNASPSTAQLHRQEDGLAAASSSLSLSAEELALKEKITSLRQKQNSLVWKMKKQEK